MAKARVRVTVRTRRPKSRRQAPRKVVVKVQQKDWRQGGAARRAVARVQNVIASRGGLGSKYLACLQDPLNADPAQVPDGYHAETTAIKLVSSGMIVNTDSTGAATFVVDSRGFGSAMSFPGGFVPTANLQAGWTQGTQLFPHNTPFMYQAPPTNYFATNFNSCDDGAAKTKPGLLCWVGTGSTSADSAGSGTPLSAQTFPGIEDFLSLYNQGRFVSGAVQLTYIGPHGDQQRGAVYINASQIGFPDNGCSHFADRSALRSHPETVKLPIGTSVTIPFYPSNVVGEGFIPLNAFHGLVGAADDAIVGANTLMKDDVVNSIATNTIIYPFVPGATVAESVWGSKSSATSDLYSITAVPLTSRSGSVAFGAATNYPSADQFLAETVEYMNLRNAAANGVLNQLPVVYFNIEGATTTITGLYDVKVVINVEAIVRPSAASFIGATEVPHVPAAITRGKTMMETLGDLGSTIGASILTASAPYATELGKMLIRKGGDIAINRVSRRFGFD